MSTSRQPDIIHMISVPRPFSFFVTLRLPCIILNTNQKTKTGEAWEWGYIWAVLRWSETHQVYHSCSASDNIRTIIEKTESVYIQKFQCSINGTLSSGEFSKSLTSERDAVGAYFASGFIDKWVYCRDPTFQVTYLSFFQLVLTVSHFFQLPECVSDCHSVYQQPHGRKNFWVFL